MNHTFRLFWLRESACDAGTLVQAAQLEPSIRERVVALAGNPEHRELLLRLPFLDQRDWRRRDEILSAIPFEREGELIRAVLDAPAVTRDLAATLMLTDPVWRDAPRPHNYGYFGTWQRLSGALQRSLKRWIFERYFRDSAKFDDRATAYTVIAYRASRPFPGRPKSSFTYEFRDYPEGTATLAEALRLTGRATQAALGEIEARLIEEGRSELARKYGPDWHEDVTLSVRRKPRKFVELLAAEAKIVNAVIDLGSDPSVQMVNRSAKTINSALRNVLGADMRALGSAVLEEATRVLAEKRPDGSDDVAAIGVFEDRYAIASGRPNSWIGGEEDRDHGCPDSGGKVRDTGIVADEDSSGREPARQLV
jgi:hypothetical protein